jgi:hypothetical protein
MSCIILIGRWCDVIVLNPHAPIEDKSDDKNDSFYEEPEEVMDQFPRYHMKILLGDFNANYGGRILSNQQSGMFYKKLIIVGLE